MTGNENAGKSIMKDEDTNNNVDLRALVVPKQVDSRSMSYNELIGFLESASLEHPTNVKAVIVTNDLKTSDGLRVRKREKVCVLYKKDNFLYVKNRKGNFGFVPAGACKIKCAKKDGKKREYSAGDEMIPRVGKDKPSIQARSEGERSQEKMCVEEGTVVVEKVEASLNSRRLTFVKNKLRSSIRKRQSIKEAIANKSCADDENPEKTKSEIKQTVEKDTRMLVACTFIASEINDVTVAAGQEVKVLQKPHEDWWWVMTSDKREGLVPSNHLVMAPAVPLRNAADSRKERPYSALASTYHAFKNEYNTIQYQRRTISIDSQTALETTQMMMQKKPGPDLHKEMQIMKLKHEYASRSSLSSLFNSNSSLNHTDLKAHFPDLEFDSGSVQSLNFHKGFPSDSFGKYLNRYGSLRRDFRSNVSIKNLEHNPRGILKNCNRKHSSVDNILSSINETTRASFRSAYLPDYKDHLIKNQEGTWC